MEEEKIDNVELNRRLVLAETRVERSKVVMESPRVRVSDSK